MGECERDIALWVVCWSCICVVLTHWGQVTHICVSKLTIIGSDNGLSLDRRQAIIWTNAGILLIGPLGTNFSEISIEIQTFSFKKMHLKMSSGKWRPSCLGLNVLTYCGLLMPYDNKDLVSTLLQVMACCHQATSHYLNQCWCLINEVLWYSSEAIFTRNAQDFKQWNMFGNRTVQIKAFIPQQPGRFRARWCIYRLG